MRLIDQVRQAGPLPLLVRLVPQNLVKGTQHGPNVVLVLLAPGLDRGLDSVLYDLLLGLSDREGVS